MINAPTYYNPAVGSITTTYQVQEIISWTYVDRGGTHTQTKTIPTTASSPPPEAEVLITPAQFHLLNVVKSRLGKTPYRDTDIVLLIIHAGYNNPDTIADIIRGGSVGSASELYRVFDEPTIAVTLNSRPEAEQRALVQQALKYNPAMGLVRSVLLQWSFDNLQHTGNFRPHALDHIFKGEINASGNATGYHYEGLPSARGATKPGTETLPDKYGVYEAEVKVNGVDKMGHGGKSTFFPRSMTPQGVVNSINEAYNNKVRVGGNLWEGHASSGMPIQMALDGTGKIITAYPVVTR